MYLVTRSLPAPQVGALAHQLVWAASGIGEFDEDLAGLGVVGEPDDSGGGRSCTFVPPSTVLGQFRHYCVSLDATKRKRKSTDDPARIETS